MFDIHLHLVWTTKYRKKVLRGDVGQRLRELIRQICREEDVEIIKGHVSADHVHLFVSIPPQVTISKLAQRLKGKSSYKMMQEYGTLRKQYWGQHLWARGYFCVSSGMSCRSAAGAIHASPHAIGRPRRRRATVTCAQESAICESYGRTR